MRVMPLTQPERDNPLMRRYFREIGLPGKQLAKRCDVSHSQTYMARKRNVGANNAEKISRRVALILGLSEQEKLELKAEIMVTTYYPALSSGGAFIIGGGMRFFRKKPEPADPFAAFSEKFGARAPRTEHAEPESEPKPESVELGTWAHQRLGVSPDASSKEISAAYRRLARKHHPDKVANLEPEVRIFSEQRMKEINAAYAQLRR
jgi:DnaJ-domain-containing protein 1